MIQILILMVAVGVFALFGALITESIKASHHKRELEIIRERRGKA